MDSPAPRRVKRSYIRFRAQHKKRRHMHIKYNYPACKRAFTAFFGFRLASCHFASATVGSTLIATRKHDAHDAR